MTEHFRAMRQLLDNIRTALAALWGNKIRSFLTMLGVIIGVFSIVTLIGIGQGVKQDVSSEITQLGANLIVVLPGQVRTEDGQFNPSGSLGASTLTDEDVVELGKLPDITERSPMSLLAGLPTADGTTAPGTLTLAVEPSYFRLFSTADLVAGRLITADDLAAKSAVAVLDLGPRRKLFPNLTPEQVLGKTFLFSGKEFSVIGLLETPPSSSAFGGSGFSDALFLPYSTAQAEFENTQVFRILLQANENADVKTVAATVKEKLKQLHHNTEDITVLTQDDLLDIVDSVVGLITSAVAGIGSISLIVGGIGIMNIMLVSVTERTKEIGLRKAIGASNSAILGQFLIEAVVLGLLGGLLGVLLATGVGVIIQNQANVSVVVNGTSVGIAVLFSALIGIIFGVAPAIRAARLNPIDALRYE
ncbi:MAG: ABC transporter permease [Candidatus Kerfeldbacteria bacterium]|nr:ABC transporter permease [Candidatus Kerfeldbacteria bacterium]